MISAGIMRGRRACAYIGMRDDVVNAGADVVDADVIVDATWSPARTTARSARS